MLKTDLFGQDNNANIKLLKGVYMDKKKDKCNSQTGDIYVNNITGKSSLILNDMKEGENKNTSELLLLDIDKNKVERIIINRSE